MNFPTLAAKNVLRNRGRTAMTIVGVTIAISAFMLLRTVLTAWDEAIEYGAKDRLATRSKISFVISLPRNYVDKIKTIGGVTDITWFNWFGAKDPKNESDFFATIATDPDSFIRVYDDLKLTPEEIAAWRADRAGAIVGEVLAKRKGWKVGDSITLRGTIFPGDWKFNVRGIYSGTKKGTDTTQLFFQWDYLNESFPAGNVRRDQIGWIVAKVKDESKGAAVVTAIDKMFEDADKQTLTQSELALNRSFVGFFGAILSAVNIVSVVILVIMMLILGNTIAMGVRERTREYGVLRAIGFLPRHVAMFILGEAATIGIMGGVFGVLLGSGVVKGFGKFLEENVPGFFPSFEVAPVTTTAAFGLAIVLGVVASILPALGAARLSVIDSLRRVG
jgi:putative ABC transport system permease protein